MVLPTLAAYVEEEWHYLLDAAHPHLPDWHIPPSQWEVYSLHGMLIVTQFIWSCLHILMSVPLREGASAAVLSFYREIVGFLALTALALRQDRAPGCRPALTQRHIKLFAISGFMSALIRVTIVAALENAGPNVTAAIVPSTPVITTLAALASGMETLRVHSVSGEMIMSGMALCCLSAVAMGMWRGPLLFGKVPVGAHAPADVPLGALIMLFNCIISSLVQIVNKQALGIYPLASCTAATELFAVCWLSLFALLSGGPWWINGSVVAAVLFGGLLATALNNVSIARANRKLGPVVANMYVPLQPVFTAVLDYIFLGDAFYTANVVCGLGVVGGLVLVKWGRIIQLTEVGEKHLAASEAGGAGGGGSAIELGIVGEEGAERAPAEGVGLGEEESRGLLAAAQLSRRVSSGGDSPSP